MESGVYRILNLVNKKCDVGSAVNFKKRWAAHRYDLYHQNHHSSHLQHAWNKYGEEAFVFEILEFCEPTKEKLLQLEQIWMDSLCSYLPERGYNICRVAGSCLGTKHSEETKKKMSRIRLGLRFRHSEESKKKMSEAARGRKCSEEAKKKMSEAHLGVKLSEEHREKISEAHLGRSCSEETRKKISEAHCGMKASEESKKKMSDSHLGKKCSEEAKKRMSKTRLGHVVSEEARRKLSEAKSRVAGLNPMTKVTFAEAQQIVLKYATGEYTYAFLAKEYSVCPGTIGYIVRKVNDLGQ